MRIAMIVFFSMLAWADTVTLKNGDRLTGTIQNTTDKGVILKSELAGEVTIPVANITEVTTAAPLVVSTKDGKKVAGTLKTENGSIVATPPSGAPVTIAAASLEALRPEAAQSAFELSQRRASDPGFLDIYSGFVDMGYASTSGNAATNTLGTSANLVRTTKHDKVTLRFASVFAQNSTTGVSITTANAIRGGIGYQRNIGSRIFLNAFNDYDYDQFLLLDLRTVLGGGLGVNLLKNARTTLTVGGGGAYNREAFGSNPAANRAAFTRSSGEVYFNQEFTHKLNAIVNVFERFSFFPNLTNTGEYRFNFDAGAAATIYKTIAVQGSFSNRFLSNPPAGRRQNDTILTTGIRYTIPTRVK